MQNNEATVSEPSSSFVACYQQGDIDAAERLARERLLASPKDELAMNVLGLCLLQRERAGEAAQVFDELARNYPEQAMHWNNLGTALREARRMEDAERAYATALRMQPDNPDFVSNMAFLQVEWKRIMKARDLLWRLFQLQPGNVEARFFGAQMCIQCGEEERAWTMLQGWQHWLPQLEEMLQVELAMLLYRLGHETEGEAILHRHLEDRHCGPAARARLVMMLERVNRLDEARAQLAELPQPEAVQDADLRYEILQAQAVVAARDSDSAHARGLIENLLREPGAERWRTEACYLLAKLCDKQGDADACMTALETAHKCQMEVAAQLVPTLVDPNSNPFTIAEFSVTAEQREGWKPVTAPSAGESPIFVLGFPRSGTTMLEQMLDAHPDMVSMDERAFVQRVIEKMKDMGLQYPEQLGELDATQCQVLRDEYWRAVADVVTVQPGQRLVDKNPLTMLRLPLLVRLFPNAKLVFCVRHPCDVLLSNYMQHFTAPAFMALSSTLPRLARGYARAMDFWFRHVEALHPQVFEWRYEDAVQDFSANVTRLGAFLELDDATPLHEFSEHARRKGYIGTPSYAQVVQPVYARSVGRWQRYRKYFEPVLPILKPAMRHWGYDA